MFIIYFAPLAELVDAFGLSPNDENHKGSSPLRCIFLISGDKMIEVELITKNPMYQVKDMNCLTIGKRAIRDKFYSDEEQENFWYDMFISEHSTLRTVQFRIVDTNMRSDISAQLLRATKNHPQPYCQSHRPDWNGGEKRKPSNETFGYFAHIHNAESFMAMCRQRLCMATMKETREKVLEILEVMQNSDEVFFRVLAKCCVPNCVYRCGCSEKRTNCGLIHKISMGNLTDIKERYKNYYDWRNK